MSKRALNLVIIVFVSLEILLRIYYAVAQTKTTIVWNDEAGIGRRMAPNQHGLFVTQSKEYKTWIDTNNEGWRDIDHSKDKSENTYRILILGDSFVENFQVDFNRTFFRQLESDLINQTGENIEVIALGLGDTGTAQQLNVLKKYGLTYKPDLIVHIFFSGNDVKNNSLSLYGDPNRPFYKLENNNLVEIPYKARSESGLFKVKNFVKSHSRLVETLLDMKGKLMARNTSYPVDYRVYDKDYSKEYSQAWDVTKALIIESKKIAEANEAEYLLVSTANNEQVNQEKIEILKKNYPEFEKADLEKPDKILSELCTTNSINCEFMLPYFRENATEPTHFFYDGHWNQIGTNLAAEFLTIKIKDLFFNNVTTQD